MHLLALAPVVGVLLVPCASTKPVIFISYSHKDEPERTPDGDIRWLTEIQGYLVPAANGTFELWTDEDIAGGADWEKDIKAKLATCDICILLVSRHSLASKYVIEVEIETILERQR
jgi:TIR domain